MAVVARFTERIPRRIRKRLDAAVVAYQPWLNGEREVDFVAATGLTESFLRGKDPVAAGLQADDLAGLEFPVPGGVDLDHGLALAA
jgi:hypothetical protein